VLRKLGILAVAAALGVGSALGAAACGEDRESDVQFEEGTGTAGTGTTGTGTTGTGTVGTGTVGTETAETVETESPETETAEGETETTP
jgi:hypothetical protein